MIKVDLSDSYSPYYYCNKKIIILSGTVIVNPGFTPGFSSWKFRIYIYTSTSKLLEMSFLKKINIILP